MRDVEEETANESLTDEQKDLVCAFIGACPELRDEQVKEWSSRHPELGDEFRITAQILAEEREQIELDGREPDEPDPELEAMIDRLFSTWKPRLLTGTRP